jgi:hypothetical protein
MDKPPRHQDALDATRVVALRLVALIRHVAAHKQQVRRIPECCGNFIPGSLIQIEKSDTPILL